MEAINVELIRGDGAKIPGRIALGRVTPDLAERVQITLQCGEMVITRSGDDYFGALEDLRHELESQNLLLNCYGASRNVSPSRASSEISYGYYAYRLTLGRPSTHKDVVTVFSSGPDVIPATVREQREFHREWLESLGWKFGCNGEILSRKISYNPYNPPLLVLGWLAISDFVRELRTRYEARRSAHPTR